MEPNCQFIGCGDIFLEPEAYPGHLRAHNTHTKDNIVLKLSPINFMELWCDAYDGPVSILSKSDTYHSSYSLRVPRSASESYIPKMEKPSSEKYHLEKF